MWNILAAAAGPLLGAAVDRGAEYLKESGFFKTDAGKAVSSVGSFLGIGSTEIGDAAASVADQLLGEQLPKLKFEDLPPAAAISPTSMAAQRMGAAGRAPQIPLGSSNRIPNMLQQPNVRNALMRVQTVPIPRSTIQSSSATISLSSAKVKSRYRKTK